MHGLPNSAKIGLQSRLLESKFNPGDVSQFVFVLADRPDGKPAAQTLFDSMQSEGTDKLADMLNHYFLATNGHISLVPLDPVIENEFHTNLIEMTIPNDRKEILDEALAKDRFVLNRYGVNKIIQTWPEPM